MMVWNKCSRWIWVDENKTDDFYGEFFTTFVCRQRSAKIRISADSNYTLFLNGKFVNSGQYPDFPHYKVYDELDLSPYCIEGENKLAVIVWYPDAPHGVALANEITKCGVEKWCNSSIARWIENAVKWADSL